MPLLWSKPLQDVSEHTSGPVGGVETLQSHNLNNRTVELGITVLGSSSGSATD